MRSHADSDVADDGGTSRAVVAVRRCSAAAAHDRRATRPDVRQVDCGDFLLCTVSNGRPKAGASVSISWLTHVSLCLCHVYDALYHGILVCRCIAIVGRLATKMVAHVELAALQVRQSDDDARCRRLSLFLEVCCLQGVPAHVGLTRA